MDWGFIATLVIAILAILGVFIEIPITRDYAFWVPFDGGCSHRLNRAVANASFWIGPRRAPSLPSSPTSKHSQVWLAFLERSFSDIGACELGPLILQRRSFNVHRSTAVCGCIQRTELVQPLRFETATRQGPLTSHPQPNTASVSDRPRDHSTSEIYRAAYRSVNATSRELKTGLNIYRMIDLEPV
jgi:hypothetical protein